MRRLRVAAAAAALAIGALPASAATPPVCRGALVYFASMATTPDAGIFAARLDRGSGRLCPLGRRAAIPKPSWIVADDDRSFLYAIGEAADPTAPAAAAFRVDRTTGDLHLADRVASGGTAAAYASLDPRSRTLFVAHWGGGAVGVIPILASGALAAPVAGVAGAGTGPGRMQGMPRSHAVRLAPGGRFLLVTEFSGDRLAVHRFDARTRRLSPNDPAGVAVVPGSGPRHLAFGRDGRFLYVVNQLSSTIDVFAWNGIAGTLARRGTVSTVAPGFSGRNDAAALILSRDGRWLYASNRGEDTIVVFAIDPVTGLPVERQRIASGGAVPRAIDLDPSGRWLLASNQSSDRVVVFSRSAANGLLAPAGNDLAMPAPAGAAFFR